MDYFLTNPSLTSSNSPSCVRQAGSTGLVFDITSSRLAEEPNRASDRFEVLNIGYDIAMKLDPDELRINPA